jgi:hypothetical protein
LKNLFKPLLAAVCLAVGLSFLFGANASALTLDKDGDYQLGGYLQNMTGIRLEDSADRSNEAGDFSMFRNELYLDFSAHISDQFQFKAITRAYYEGVWALDNDVDQKPKDMTTLPGPDTLDMESDIDFREYYVTYNAGDFVFKLGRQQVAWGEADAMRLADIINPLDLSWRWSFPTWEDIRIPLKMLNAFYTVPNSAHELKFELVYIPADFSPHQFAAPGANWALYSNLGYPHVVEEAIFQAMRQSLPDRDISNPSGGARMKALLGPFETYWFVFYGRDQTGVFDFDPGALATNPVFPMKFHYPYVTTFGQTFNAYCPFLKSVIRGEFAYAKDTPYSDLTAAPYVTKDTFSFMLGFDNNTMVPFLNPTKSFFISGQVFNKFVINLDEDKYRTFLGDNDAKDQQTILSLMINTEYYEGKIAPQVLGVWFINEESGFFDANIAYKPNFSLSFTLGYLGIWGNDNMAGLYFGPVKNNDEVYAKIKLSF